MVGTTSLVPHTVPLLHDSLQVFNGPELTVGRGGCSVKQIRWRVCPQLRGQLIDSLFGKAVAIAARSPIDQPGNTLCAEHTAPIH